MTFEEKFIEEIRKKFQNSESRINMLSVMIDEIKLQQMQEKQRNVPYMDAIEVLQEEFEYAASSKVSLDVSQVLKDFGF